MISLSHLRASGHLRRKSRSSKNMTLRQTWLGVIGGVCGGEDMGVIPSSNLYKVKRLTGPKRKGYHDENVDTS
jgi:hypothetical protein